MLCKNICITYMYIYIRVYRYRYIHFVYSVIHPFICLFSYQGLIIQPSYSSNISKHLLSARSALLTCAREETSETSTIQQPSPPIHDQMSMLYDLCTYKFYVVYDAHVHIQRYISTYIYTIIYIHQMEKDDDAHCIVLHISTITFMIRY